MEEFKLGDQIIVYPVYDKTTGERIGSIECWLTDDGEFGSFYKVDNRLARRFDIPPDIEFLTTYAIMKLINNGG